MRTITARGPRLTAVANASGSMATIVPVRNRSRTDVTKASLIQALGRFTPDDEIGLWEFATTLDGAKDYRRPVPTARLGDPVKGGGTHRSKLAAAFSAFQPAPNGAAGPYDTTPAASRRHSAHVAHRTQRRATPVYGLSGKPTGQVCTGSPLCISSAYRRVVAPSAASRASPASSPRWYVSACQDAPFTRRLQRSSMTPR